MWSPNQANCHITRHVVLVETYCIMWCQQLLKVELPRRPQTPSQESQPPRPTGRVRLHGWACWTNWPIQITGSDIAHKAWALTSSWHLGHCRLIYAAVTASHLMNLDSIRRCLVLCSDPCTLGITLWAPTPAASCLLRAWWPAPLKLAASGAGYRKIQATLPGIPALDR